MMKYRFRYKLLIWTGECWGWPYEAVTFAGVLSYARQYHGWRIYDRWQKVWIAEQIPSQHEWIHKIGE